MAKVPRVVTVAAAALGVVVLTALFISVPVNLRDPEISAQARTMAHFESRAIVDESNAYVALLGLSAPQRTDPIAEGKRLAAEYDSALYADPFARQRRPHRALERDSDQDDLIEFAGDPDAACDIFNEPCMPFALARQRAVRALVSANRLLIDRYENARRLPGFAAVPIADQGRAAVERSNLGRLHAILLTSAALDGQQGRAAAACGFLASDGAFWRRMLSGAGTLGDKLSAFHGLGEDARLAAELIASPGFDAASCGPALRTLLAPVTGKETSLADAFRMAFVPMVRMLASWPDPAVSVEPEPWVDRHLKETPLYDLYYCRNATINRSAQLYADLAALAAQPPADFVAARDAFLSDYRDLVSIHPDWFYNPLGKMLLGRHLPLHVDYVAHAHGVAAYVDLVRTQLDLRLAGVPLAQVPRFLERPDNANPLDGRPFHWDGARRSLSFDPLDRRWRRWGTSVTVAEPVIRR
jgi:hypothetical protein